MSLDLGWYNGLVDDDGTGTTGTVWNKAALGSLFGVINWRVRDWVTVPFNAANFYGGGSQTWTVDAGDVGANRYAVCGAVAVWEVVVSSSTVGGTPNPYLWLNLPSGLTALSATHYQPVGFCIDNGAQIQAVVQVGSGTALAVSRLLGGNWAASTNATYLYLHTLFSIAN